MMRGIDAASLPQRDGELREGDPVLFFGSARDWDRWLSASHRSSCGVWLKIAKRGAAIESVTYAEALEAALCWGWIDAKKGRYDEQFFLQRFTPRKPRSIWSKVNQKKALELIASGRMRQSGLAAVEAAKKNGRWENAYDSVAQATVPADLEAALAKDREAREFFAKLKGQNRYAILHRLQTAKKPETRAKRLERFVSMLARGETIYPQ